VAKVETTLLKGLQNKDVDTNVIHQVARRLNERFDEAMKNLEGQVIERRNNPSGASNPTAAAREAVDDEQELREAIDQMRTPQDGQAAGEAAEMPPEPGRSRKPIDPVAIQLPRGILDRETIIFFIDREIARVLAYKTKFAAMLLGINILRARRKTKDPISRNAVMNMVLERLTNIFRGTDIPGMLDDNKIMVVLPMVARLEARKAMSRIMKEVHEHPYELNGVPLRVKLAGITTEFDLDVTPTRKEFIARVEADMSDMLLRLQNIQSIT
jgi:GGDEF domain-containing protein